MTTQTNHPDIEIYIKNAEHTDIVKWLSQRFDSFTSLGHKGVLHTWHASYQDHTFKVAIHERALGKSWSSVWFQSDNTPWSIDLDCAREAAKVLNLQVRCIASGWQEGDNPDEWWKLENGTEEKIEWKTD